MTGIDSYPGSEAQQAFDADVSERYLRILGPATKILQYVTMMDQRTLSPIFEEERVGPRGPYVVKKLRTLRETGEPHQPVYGADHPHSTRFSRLLRRTGADEIFQLHDVNDPNIPIHMVGLRAKNKRAIEQLAALDPVLFNEWEDCYLQPHAQGLVGLSQLMLKQKRGLYSDRDLIDGMRLDIHQYSHASLQNDEHIVAMARPVLLRQILPWRRPDQTLPIGLPDVALEQAA
jgi:lipopolysaccharide/colanic/teichoic acid biosynthesis glycosyltransferase